MLDSLKARARQLKSDVFALYLAARHPGTPWYAKVLIVAIVAYALSPIDLIPDFIPVLGLLDDLILLPLGIALALRLIPETVIAECRARALADPPKAVFAGRAGAAAVVVLWAGAAVMAFYVVRHLTAE